MIELKSLRPILLTIAGLAFVLGCGGAPQVAKENRKLIETVLTAVSSGNQAWLESNEKLLQTAHEKGQLSDAEFAAFSAILQQARSGDWKGATARARTLAASQRPHEDESSHALAKHKKKPKPS